MCSSDLVILSGRGLKTDAASLAALGYYCLRAFSALITLGRIESQRPGDLSERETAMLRVLAFALQMNTNTQTTVEAMVGEVLADAGTMRDRKAVLTALRREVARRYPTEPARADA